MVIESLISWIFLRLGQRQLLPDLSVLVERLSGRLGEHCFGAGSAVHLRLTG